jgi:formylglycine-generating enzyme required for sulfatase activity
MQATCAKNRNPNTEIRCKSESQMTQGSKPRRGSHGLGHWDLRASGLLRISDFGIRIWWLLLGGTVHTPAQNPVGLDIQTYAGLTITGAVGTVYSVEYITDLARTNTPSAWRCLEYYQLPTNPYLWTDKSAPATGRRFYRAVQAGAPTYMVFIPPGTFRMGSSTNEVDRYLDQESPQTAVTISRGFWLGKYEVTQREYLALMGHNPSFFTTNDVNGNAIPPDLNRPVEQVSWFEATNYCGRLTERERAAGRIAANSAYRLPTEAEWEYACRGWTSMRFSYGEDPGYTNLTDYAWYNENSGGMTHPVGRKLPNPWGLYDMHGHVLEWCQDWFADYLPGGIAVDPQGPVSGRFRVMCGGFWAGPARHCRSAFRFGLDPGTKFIHIGLRVVLAPGQ